MKQHRFPRKWATALYRLLAVGRYSAFWLPELIELYARIVEEEGEKKADKWLLEELTGSFWTSVGYRAFKLLRAAYLTWEAYKKIARD